MVLAKGRGWVPASPKEASAPAPGVVDDAIPPGPVTVAGRREGKVDVFTWDYSAAQASDTFQWKVVGGAAGVAKSPTVRVPAQAGAKVCLTIKVVRADGSNAAQDWSPPGCVA